MLPDLPVARPNATVAFSCGSKRGLFLARFRSPPLPCCSAGGDCRRRCADRFWQDDVKHGDGVYYYVAKGTCYAGVWKNGSPKCGEMMDINPDAPDARRHALPELRLADPDAVLDAAAEQHAQED